MSTDSPDMEQPAKFIQLSPRRTFLLGFVFTAALICVCGNIYNWVDITNFLNRENQFVELCHGKLNDKGSCNSRDAQLNLIYTVAVNVASIGNVVWGFSLDRFGPRTNAVCGAIILSIGYLLFGLSDSEKFDAFIPGYAMIAFGGISVFISHFQVCRLLLEFLSYSCAFQFANLFQHTYLASALLSGCFNACGLIFTLFWALHTVTSRKTLFVIMSSIVAVCGFIMFMIYPDRPYKQGDHVVFPVDRWFSTSVSHLCVNESAQQDEPLLQDEPSISDANVEVALDSPKPLIEVSASSDASSDEPIKKRSPEWIKARTIGQELTDAVTIWMGAYFAFSLLAMNWFNASVSSQIGDDAVLSNMFVWLSALLPISLSFYSDRLKEQFKYHGLTVICTVCTGFMFVFTLIPNKWALIPSFFMLAIQRSLLFPMLFSYPATFCRLEHYGTIIAVLVGMAAAVGFLQIAVQALATAMPHGNTIVNAFFAIAFIPFLYFSVMLKRENM